MQSFEALEHETLEVVKIAIARLQTGLDDTWDAIETDEAKTPIKNISQSSLATNSETSEYSVEAPDLLATLNGLIADLSSGNSKQSKLLQYLVEKVIPTIQAAKAHTTLNTISDSQQTLVAHFFVLSELCQNKPHPTLPNTDNQTTDLIQGLLEKLVYINSPNEAMLRDKFELLFRRQADEYTKQLSKDKTTVAHQSKNMFTEAWETFKKRAVSIDSTGHNSEQNSTTQYAAERL